MKNKEAGINVNLSTYWYLSTFGCDTWDYKTLKYCTKKIVAAISRVLHMLIPCFLLGFRFIRFL